MGETDPLRELHEAYVWKVNEAVAEGRMDLVREFADQYTDEALELMATLQSPGCGRPDCTRCTPVDSSPTVAPRRRRFWRLHRSPS